MLIGVENKRVYFSKSLKYDLKRAHSLCRCSLADPSREVFNQKPFPPLFSPLLLEGQGRSSRTPTASTHGLQVSSAQRISNLERPRICLLVILLNVLLLFSWLVVQELKSFP